MNFLLYLVLLLLSGLVVGALARLALPGKDPMTIPQTIAIGVAGSLLAGLVGALLFGRGGGGILLSIVFAAAIVYFVRRSRGGGLTQPGVPPEER
ncbi:MAG: GlsB/YeaQ/YmgE family stress response membrane protein [Solirubrobacteraceae bacterium]